MPNELKLTNAGKAIRSIRAEQGLGLRELADRLGWDRGRLSKYENDELGLSVEVLTDIAKAMGMRPEVLVLRCLQTRFPKLRNTEAGSLIEKMVKLLDQS